MEALLTQAKIALMEQPLPAREIEEWRGRQARYAPRYHADAIVEFIYIYLFQPVGLRVFYNFFF
jgi:hypothetical protein